MRVAAGVLAVLLAGCGDPTGADRARSISIVPPASGVIAGDTLVLRAVARDAAGVGVADPGVRWRTTDPALGLVPHPDTGVVVGAGGRGTVAIIAELVNGSADTVLVPTYPRPTVIAVLAGAGANACINAPLEDEMVVVANAADGGPVPGVALDIILSGGGTPSLPRGLTDSVGRLAFGGTLGDSAGPQAVRLATRYLPGDTTVIPIDALPLGRWTWVAGSPDPLQPARRGARGVPDAGNSPGARQGAAFAVAADGSIWLFGGRDAGAGYLNDLWRFDGVAWTWVAGSDLPDQSGVYGERGVPAAANAPGGRENPVLWGHPDGSVWLFGGRGRGAGGGPIGFFNDLWRFDAGVWTWMAGSDSTNDRGFFGVRGSGDSATGPQSRQLAAGWTVGGDLWLFGGMVPSGAENVTAVRDDVWRFDGAVWTWVAGDSLLNAPPIHGASGAPSPGATPGGRFSATAWTSPGGVPHLFGGAMPSTSLFVNDVYNDLWQRAGTNWIWIAGNDVPNGAASFGIRGRTDPGNVPGARAGSVVATAPSGDAWLFGGANRNDLWRLRSGNWVWVGGSQTPGAANLRGTLGVPDAANTPGARRPDAMWVDRNGTLWLYGGGGYTDMWRFDIACLL